MNVTRKWITPFTAGAFLLSAATGILIFFHMGSGLNKFIHEWFSWALVAGVALHVALNFKPLIKYLSTRQGLLIVGIFVAILAAGLVPGGKKNDPPFMLPIRALSQVPLTTLAQVARISPQRLMLRLSKEGVRPASDQHRLSDIVGSDIRKQMQVLNAVFSEAR